MKSLKKLIRSIFVKLFGVIVIKNRHKDYGFNKILTKIVSDDQPIIFDIGASEGSSYERYKKIFSNPVIHSFEPLTNEFEIMKKKFKENNNLFLNNVAVGSKPEIKIFKSKKRDARKNAMETNLDLAIGDPQTQVPRRLNQFPTLLGGSSGARNSSGLVEMVGGFELKPGVARGRVLRREVSSQNWGRGRGSPRLRRRVRHRHFGAQLRVQ